MRQDQGRNNQKLRTRLALVSAAQDVIAAGGQPTVAEVAELAKVSRATAYRYFPTQQALEVELAAQALYAGLEREIAALTLPDAEQRLVGVIERYGELAQTAEAHMRTALMVYHDTWLRAHRAEGTLPPLRRGRRMEWLNTILEPLPELPPEQEARLRAALALTIGADSLLALKDVVGLSHEDAVAVQCWAGRVLLRAGLEEAGA